MFITPSETIAYFGAQEGMRIADLGCGTGAYTLALAEQVRGGGKVYGIEVQRELLERIKSETQKKHLTNIEVIWGTIEKIGGTKLAEHSIDLAVMSNVLFQVEDRIGCMKEIIRILKPHGRIVLIDWADSFGGMGPIAEHVITHDKAVEIFAQYGFTVDREFPAGSHHYGVTFKK